MTDLVALFELQEHDSAIAALSSQRVHLPGRAELDGVLRSGQIAHEQLGAVRGRRDELHRSLKLLDDQTHTAAAKVKAVNDRLYSGKVTATRELQDLQADLDNSERHLGELEDREIELMVEVEQVDAEVIAAETILADLAKNVETLRGSIAQSEVEIDNQISAIGLLRTESARTLPPELVADYERRRELNRGVGAALLIGNTCQGCRLTIPAVEASEVHADKSGQVFSCDNCGAILVVR